MNAIVSRIEHALATLCFRANCRPDDGSRDAARAVVGALLRDHARPHPDHAGACLLSAWLRDAAAVPADVNVYVTFSSVLLRGDPFAGEQPTATVSLQACVRDAVSGTPGCVLTQTKEAA